MPSARHGSVWKNTKGRKMDRAIISVTELNLYIKATFDENPFLRGLFVRGEISNFKRYQSGHCYFTLKDEACAVRAVIYKQDAMRLPFAPADGMKVIASCRATVYERDGQYQLCVSELQPDGIGSLHVAYEQLKRKLEAEGLFDEDRKRPIPEFPKRIGVITSPSGAAVRDIINVTGRRFPSAEVIIFPAVVQGEESAPSLLRGLSYFCDPNRADVIIIGRGGGSIEDLWSFNDERVVRAVASSPVPVISAVGHETDFTLCDFAADLRAPTPSAAAECATPDRAELAAATEARAKRLSDLAGRKISLLREKLTRLAGSRALTSPMNFIDDRRMALDGLEEKLVLRASLSVEEKRAALRENAAKLGAMDPLAVLSRGYSASFDEGGNVIKSIKTVRAGDTLITRISDGKLISKISSVEKTGGKKRGKKENEI